MQRLYLFILLFYIKAFTLFMLNAVADFRHKRHRLSLRSVQHLKKMGMDNKGIQGLTKAMNFKEKGRTKNSKQGNDKKHKCGDALRDLLVYVFDRSDMDAQRLVAGQLNSEKFSIFTGKFSEKEIPVEKLLLPIETVGDKCFAIRPKNDLPMILCAGCSSKRKTWVNALHEAILCKKTRVKGMIFDTPQAELESETVTLAEETTPSGINIHIANSPKGKPEIMINGMTIQQMQKIEKDNVESEVKIKPPSPSISDLSPRIINEPEEPDNSVNSMSQPRSEGEVEALMESKAEHGALSKDDKRVPKYGYEATKRGMNKHHLNQ